MNRSKERNKKHVNEMDERLGYVVSLINYNTDSDIIFQDFELHSEVLKILEEIEEYWLLYINNSKDLNVIFHSYIDIIDIIKKNKKHYDSTSDNKEELYTPFELQYWTTELNKDNKTNELKNSKPKKG